eukprot:6999943-Prorocentrum_lima.AAC.1
MPSPVIDMQAWLAAFKSCPSGWAAKVQKWQPQPWDFGDAYQPNTQLTTDADSSGAAQDAGHA